jgi:hypothetical protein
MRPALRAPLPRPLLKRAPRRLLRQWRHHPRRLLRPHRHHQGPRPRLCRPRCPLPPLSLLSQPWPPPPRRPAPQVPPVTSRSSAAPGPKSFRPCPKSSAARGRWWSPTRKWAPLTDRSSRFPSLQRAWRAPSAAPTIPITSDRQSTRPWASTARSPQLPVAPTAQRALNQTQKHPLARRSLPRLRMWRGASLPSAVERRRTPSPRGSELGRGWPHRPNHCQRRSSGRLRVQVRRRLNQQNRAAQSLNTLPRTLPPRRVRRIHRTRPKRPARISALPARTPTPTMTGVRLGTRTLRR